MKEEPVLKMYDNIYQEYCELVQKNDRGNKYFEDKDDITKIEEKLTLDKSKIKAIENIIYIKKREHLINIIMLLNGLYKALDLKNSQVEAYKSLKKICHSGKNINYMYNEIKKFF